MIYAIGKDNYKKKNPPGFSNSINHCSKAVYVYRDF